MRTRLLSALILLVGSTVVPANAGDRKLPPAPPVVREYSEEDGLAEMPRLRAIFRRAELPEGYEAQALLALSHFPELANIRIRFVQKDAGHAISSRPLPVSAFRRPKKRLYLVVIDTESNGEREALLLRNQPFNAQVGILGHELSHTAWYIHRSLGGIIRDGLCQFSRPCRMQFERSTDFRLIDHGLGWQRYDHSSFVRSRFRESGVVSTGGGGSYMGPPELLAYMAETGIYNVEDVDRGAN